MTGRRAGNAERRLTVAWLLAYLGAASASGVVIYFVAHIPVQVSDCLGNMLQVQQVGYWELFKGYLLNYGYIRPMTWIQIKFAYELAGGNYLFWFKLIHGAQILAGALLLVRLFRVRSWQECAMVPLALAVFFGLHTFSGTVNEAFPVNGFLMVVVATLLAANLAISESRWWKDVAAVAVLAFSVLSVESGLLVAVALVAARMAGFRGVSWWGLGCCVAVVAGYFYLRFGAMHLGMPGLGERATGFGLGVLEPAVMRERFGANPMPLYAYNVLSSLSTVLFSEPRGGVWVALRRVVEHADIPKWLIVNLASSLLATGLVFRYGVRALSRWWAGRASHGDRVAFVSLGVVIANAVLCFGYTKNVMMSVGGAFFAVLVYQAMADAAVAARQAGVLSRSLGLTLVLALSTLWGVRAVGLTVLLREGAFSTRNDWASVEEWLGDQRIVWSAPDARSLVSTLRAAALRSGIQHPDRSRPASYELFDLD